MPILLQAGGDLPISFTAVYIIGFIAAVTIGSIAWYNSKRPAGWEGSERPNFIPKVNKKVNKQDSSESEDGESGSDRE
ncbi:MAG: hypothetical protein BRC58_08835 [Cyanobacteria bacterium QS_8_64_29]|nr:MAG: hypothetical protein BRC58_08835 [Cyanobacteria bacterium QS_8_64_29]